MSATPSSQVKEIVVGIGTCGIAAGARKTFAAIESSLSDRGVKASMGITGCVGMCYLEPLVEVVHGDGSRYLYKKVNEKKAARIIDNSGYNCF